ncbi:MAG: hypothetical protein AAF662_06035 [Pseudomonadota bacterium]
MNGDDKKLISHSRHLVAFMASVTRKWRVTQTLIVGRYPEIRADELADAGFRVCTESLYFSVIHDLAALLFDEGRKTPSLATCLQILSQSVVERRLRNHYVASASGDYEGQQRFRDEFDIAVRRLREGIPAVLEFGDATACRRARDKYVAHFSLSGEGKYSMQLKIQHFGLLLDTPNRLIKRLLPVLDDLSLITGNTLFAWDAHAEENEQISTQLAIGFRGEAGVIPDIEDLIEQFEPVPHAQPSVFNVLMHTSRDDDE